MSKHTMTYSFLAGLCMIFAGCTTYINIPAEQGSIASSDPNTGTVNKVIVSAIDALMVQQGTTEQPIELLLPEGTSGASAWMIQEKLGDYVFSRSAEKVVLKRFEDYNPEIDVLAEGEVTELEVDGSVEEEMINGEEGIVEDTDAEPEDAVEVVTGMDVLAEVEESEIAEGEMVEAVAEVEDVEPLRPEFIRVVLSQGDAPETDVQYDVKGVRVRGIKAEVDVYKMTHYTLDQFYSIKLNYEAFTGWRVKRIDSLGVLRDAKLDGDVLPVKETP
ncbi:hypothetical protein KS4_15050 [Poriferisphaera corsica]|uniref:Uncharacterized protein n=1 Tax=Poriferisphaera corsica TaxID=2528020 RepID=A0A517YT97_9BACT|nr:hypothetical protein [Poriferisphaera corsica]QDU33457.1 hypothetical protein KS4_15050 [Poriferisphaera corsica]